MKNIISNSLISNSKLFEKIIVHENESKENKNNKKIQDNSIEKNGRLKFFLLFNEGNHKNFILETNKNALNIEFIVILQDSEYCFKKYKNIFTYEEMKKTKCFFTDDTLDDIYISVEKLIELKKIKLININEENLILIFEDENSRKKIYSEFMLNIDEIEINNLIEILIEKVNLISRISGTNKDQIEFLNKEIENLKNKLENYKNYERNQKDNIQCLNDSFKQIKKDDPNEIHIQKDNLNQNSKYFSNDEIISELKNQIKLNEELHKENANQKIINEKIISEMNILKVDLLSIKSENEYMNQELIKIKDNFHRKNQIIIKPLEFINVSRILKFKEISLLKHWIGYDYRMELLYSSDIHGKDVQIYHTNCDGHTNCLTLIKSEFKKRFGGYTKLKLSSRSEWVNGDGSDFIFSLTKKRKFLNNQPEFSIYNNPNRFPTFGEGCDFSLYKDCFENNSLTYSNFPYSYGLGEILDEEKNSYLAGNKYFKVKRLEVFKIHHTKDP